MFQLVGTKLYGVVLRRYDLGFVLSTHVQLVGTELFVWSYFPLLSCIRFSM